MAQFGEGSDFRCSASSGCPPPHADKTKHTINKSFFMNTSSPKDMAIQKQRNTG